MQIQSHYALTHGNNQYARTQSKDDKSVSLPQEKQALDAQQDTNANKQNDINETALSLSQTNQTQESKEVDSKVLQTEEKSKNEPPEEHKNRITYGLKVLELMSDEEYRAFLWATEGMNDSEKLLMAQSLYRFTDFYQGKAQQDTPVDLQMRYAYRAFGIENTMIEDFIERYKNAYAKNVMLNLDFTPIQT